MAELSQPPLLSKFQGCMVGAWVGDCLGEKYEFCRPLNPTLHNYMTKIFNGERTKILRYTDDSAMTLCIAKSLVEKNGIDPKDLAFRFVEEYYRNPDRCYGGHVVNVFKILKNTESNDVFKPAQNQFNGSGSYGNGAAMRISPVALFGSARGIDYLKDAVKQSSCITHTHPLGINGALLQAFAIVDALKLNPNNELDALDFINQLQSKVTDFEEKGFPYYQSLEKMKDYLKDGVNGKDIAEHLGNQEIAQKSVPSAIYSFLRGMRPLPDFDCPNPFMRTMYFAISIGGDTDTIASMAGAIAGAYYGVDIIPEVVKKQCEMIEAVSEVADKLYAKCNSL